MDSTIGLKQKVFVDITFRPTKKGWPMLVIESKIDGKDFKKFLPTWEGMKPASVNRLKADITALLKAVGGDESVVSDTYSSAQDFMAAVVSAIPEDHADVPVDIFLEYEQSIAPPYTNSSGVTVTPNRTWPEIAESYYENKADFPWIVAAQKGKYEPVVGENGLEYKTSNGLSHPISRPKSWLSSSRAIVTKNYIDYKKELEGWASNATKEVSPATASAPSRPEPSDDLPF
jgi:hypothetical protein